MKRRILLFLTVAGACALMRAAPGSAEVPKLIRYQGTLVDTNNVPLEGTYNLTLRLYGAATGGTALWTETQTGLSIARGVFNVLLGQVTPITLSFDGDYWLSTQVGTDAEMSPRQRLTSVPYAYRATVAEQLGASTGFRVDTAKTLTNGLVAYWKLGEPNGARNDSIGAHHLTDNNTVTQGTGKVGNAAQFTLYNNESLSVVSNDLSPGNHDFSIAFWFKREITGQILVSKDADGAREFYFQMQGSGVPIFYLFNNTGGQNSVAWWGGAPAGIWMLAVAWYDAGAHVLGMQIARADVPFDANDTMTTNVTITPVNTNAPFRIGSRTNDSYFTGLIDEVGFWNRVLTTQERADLHNAGTGNTYELAKSVAWTENSAGVFYDGGNVGIGAASPTNILTVQQGSATDPIADSWLTYPSDRRHKQILRTLPRTGRAGYLDKIKQVELYEWTRTPVVREREISERAGQAALTKGERDSMRRQLAEEKAKLPKFKARRVGVAIDDDDVPSEILVYDTDGHKAGIDLLAYVGYLHAALKEAAVRIGDLEANSRK